MSKLRDASLVSLGITIITLMGLGMSCQNKVTPLPPTQRLEVATSDLKKNTEVIGKAAVEGEQKTPAAAKPVLSPYWTTIRIANDDNRQIAAELLTAKAEAVKLAEDRDNQVKRAERAEESTSQERNKALNWIIVSSILVAGVAIAIGLSGKLQAFVVAAAAGVVIALAMFVQSLAPILPWILGGVSVGGIGWMVYSLHRSKNAAAELVKMAEVAKRIVGKPEMIYGNGGIADVLQSPSTKKLVRAVKRTLPASTMPKPTPTTPVDPWTGQMAS